MSATWLELNWRLQRLQRYSVEEFVGSMVKRLQNNIMMSLDATMTLLFEQQLFKEMIKVCKLYMRRAHPLPIVGSGAEN